MPTTRSSLKEKKKLVRKIDRLLRAVYGEPEKHDSQDPLDILIQTILSQNTSDLNSGRAFSSLQKTFPSWNAARMAETAQLEEAIRIGGLSKTKARRIKEILSSIHEKWGRTSLQFLRAMPAAQASRILSDFPGVGPKTLHCVLLFGCNVDVFPVDTHILRLSKRLGLIEESTTLADAHILWTQFIPPGVAFSLHINLINHGRKVCRARNPRCFDCVLKSLCPAS